MLGFINTSILIALLGIAIPLLIHLLAKQKVKRVYFSSLMFLKQVQSQHFKRLRIRQILLLVVRCLIVLFLVLAFARPTFRSHARMLARSRCHSVIVFDHSMSMSRGKVWSRAQNAAMRILHLFDHTDDVALIVRPQTVPVLLGQQLDRIGAEIQKAEPVYDASALDELLNTASGLLNGTDINREVVLITDLQASTAFRDDDSTAVLRHVDLCHVISVTEDVDNTAITGGGIESQILSPGNPVRVFAQIRNYSTTPVQDLLVRLIVNGSSCSQKMVNIPAGGTMRVDFQVMNPDPGWMLGQIEIDEDAFIADNQWFFSAQIPETIRALLIGGRPADLLPVKLVLAPHQGHASFSISEAITGSDWTWRLSDIDVAYMINCPALTEIELQNLMRFVENGGGLIIFPGSDSDIRQLNERLTGPFGFLLGNISGMTGSGMSGSDAFHSLGPVNFEHPLFEQIFDGKGEFESPRFFRTIQLTETGSNQIVMRYRNGDPFLAVHDRDQRTMILATSSISTPWSDFHTNPFFAPLIYRLGLFAGGRIREDNAGFSGGALQVPLPTVPPEGSRFTANFPGGEQVDVLPVVSGRHVQIRIDRASSPGFYRIRQNDSLLCVRAVNMNPDESDFTPMDPALFTKHFEKLNIHFLTDDASLENGIRQSRWGKELGWEMLLIALLFMLAEIILARSAKKES